MGATILVAAAVCCVASTSAGASRASPPPPADQQLAQLIDNEGLAVILGQPVTGPEDLGTFPYEAGVLSIARVLSANGLLYALELYTMPTIDDARAQFFAIQGGRIPTGNVVQAGEFAQYAFGTIVVHKSGQVLVISESETGAALDELIAQQNAGNDTTLLRTVFQTSVIPLAQNIADLMSGQTSTSQGTFLPDGAIDPCSFFPDAATEAFGNPPAFFVPMATPRAPALMCRVGLADGTFVFDMFVVTDAMMAKSVYVDDIDVVYESQRAGNTESGATPLAGLGDDAIVLNAPDRPLLLETIVHGQDLAAIVTFFAEPGSAAGLNPDDIIAAWQSIAERVLTTVPELLPPETTTTTSSTTTTTTTTTTVAPAPAPTAPSPAEEEPDAPVAAPAVEELSAEEPAAAPADAGPSPAAQSSSTSDDEDGSGVGTVLLAVGLPSLAAIAAGGVLLNRRRGKRSPTTQAPHVRATAGNGTHGASPTGAPATSIGIRAVAGPATTSAREKENPR